MDRKEIIRRKGLLIDMRVKKERMRKSVLFMIIGLLFIGMTACGNATDADGTDMPEEQSADSNGQLAFSTTDLNGVPIKLADIKGASLIMVNFWEPWCGPCVGEMPELEKLYQNYKEQGLIILGVFYSTSDMDAAKSVVSENQITYPIVIGNDDFGPFTTEYVPTTVFFDSEGNLLSDDAVVGAQSYDAWEQEIAKYLDGLQS